MAFFMLSEGDSELVDACRISLSEENNHQIIAYGKDGHGVIMGTWPHYRAKEEYEKVIAWVEKGGVGIFRFTC
jgi:hypothetical protein